MADNHDQLIQDMGEKARAAAMRLALATTEGKAAAVKAAAQAMRDDSAAILEANAKDMENASDLPAAMQDRLKLDQDRLNGIADAADQVASLPDPVGEIIKEWEQPNGLKFERRRVPLGVVGIIYESRPNVTADAGLLCLMAGNAAILRGGSEAVHSNRAIHAAIVKGVEKAGLPGDAVQLMPTQDRGAVGSMLKAAGLIDIIIPRGGKGLVARVQEEARVPVLAHLDGICHVYVDGAADPEKAREIAVNAKMRRTGICGAMETLLIDEAAHSFAPDVIKGLLDAGCEVRGDAKVEQMDERVKAASDEDWDTEYLEPIVSARLVDGVDGAARHIAAHGSHHTDSIVTEDKTIAARFLNEVDSAIVMHNASTQFADGGEFGFGAEIGIATGRLHARGPVALEGLTTYKTVVHGEGQTRPS
ncbi:glutamate-5-semialdehyde dehydrogenase [Novosphingopyxis sp. YJ-S2-01]|uniref:glutamate-5-semialdehyde dehydrogenase n=1 Tax=Novosphingopyxis sp. YJ-S2-01 TaxID=2794021 RepID=UPI0018DDB149|nr:glutamate-5-semialdehyde dehydrogenase [Novosphingopyxis sp. YJ-S2-01]MBH9536850.1 glutamate-5-semialdehyde dehydrogenase [Novosphingopyxis sp. YJ-S2-01]